MLLLVTYNLDASMARRGVDQQKAEFSWRDNWVVSHRRRVLESSVLTSTTTIIFHSSHILVVEWKVVVFFLFLGKHITISLVNIAYKVGFITQFVASWVVNNSKLIDFTSCQNNNFLLKWKLLLVVVNCEWGDWSLQIRKATTKQDLACFPLVYFVKSGFSSLIVA